MMHMIEFKGVQGVFKFLGLLLAVLLLMVGLPSLFMMVLWNAIVFEAFGGPEIVFYQGIILWLATVVLLQILLQPEIELQVKKMPPAGKPFDPTASEDKPNAEKHPSDRPSSHES